MKKLFWSAVFCLSTMVSGGIFADGGLEDPVVKELPNGIADLVKHEQYEAAIVELKKFMRNEVKNPDAWNLLAFSQRKLGDMSQAMKSYKRALRLDSGHLGANEYIGELYLKLNKPKKAKKHLKRLKRKCGECEQKKKLEAAIAAYKSGNSSGGNY